MAALTSLAVSSPAPNSATITLNGTAYDLTGHQVAQLYKLVRRLTVECTQSKPAHTGVTVTKPSQWGQ